MKHFPAKYRWLLILNLFDPHTLSNAIKDGVRGVTYTKYSGGSRNFEKRAPEKGTPPEIAKN
jgi:hypothetical protein